MERIRCKEIVLDTYSVGTMDVMDYADEHPNEYFDFTHVYSKHTDFGMLVVSEYEEDNLMRDCDEEGLYEWRDLPNGWQRRSNYGVFVCRKNGRQIIITG